MPLGSNLTPEQILHEQKCSKKNHELYFPKNGVVEVFWLMGAASFVVIGTKRALKGRTFSVREWSYWLTGFLTLASIETCWFNVSVFFQIINDITKLI